MPRSATATWSMSAAPRAPEPIKALTSSAIKNAGIDAGVFVFLGSPRRVSPPGAIEDSSFDAFSSREPCPLRSKTLLIEQRVDVVLRGVADVAVHLRAVEQLGVAFTAI